MHVLQLFRKKGPLDEEEETYLTHAALVAQGHAKVEPECLTGSDFR